MVSREEVVAEARTWLGTPFMEQHRVKGVGVDCALLQVGICVALDLLPAEPAALARYRGYSHHAAAGSCETFHEAMCALFAPIAVAGMQPADVVMLYWSDKAPPKGVRPVHAGILGDYTGCRLTLIHATPRGVLEHRLTDEWRRRVIAAYRIPGVE